MHKRQNCFNKTCSARFVVLCDMVYTLGQMKRSGLFGVILCCVVAAVPSIAWAQDGSVVLRGGVSRTVALSLSPEATHARVENAFESGEVLRLVISGSGSEIKNIEFPILIRSNTSYNLIASSQSRTAVVKDLRVLRIEPGGKLVAGDAVSGVTIRPQFDHASNPAFVLSGPRISLGGGLTTPDNALKVVLLLSVEPKKDGGRWTIVTVFRSNDLPSQSRAR